MITILINVLKKNIENILSDILSVFIKPLILLQDFSKVVRMALFKSKLPNTYFIAEAANLKFIINSSDRGVGYPTYINKIPYDSEKIDMVFKILPLKSNPILLDIGANLGTIGLTACANGHVSEVWAFEPDPQNFALLECNTILNGFTHQVKIFNLALTSTTESVELELELDQVNFGDHRIRKSKEIGLFKEENRKVIKVKSTMLDTICRENNLDFSRAVIWIDTQGFEGHVLLGGSSLIKKRVPIITEFWPYGLKRANCFEIFVKIIHEGPYKNIIDLKNYNIIFPCNEKTLINFSRNYGFNGDSTDLLIY